MTKILKCRISNIMGVKSAEFEPQGHHVTIGGKNGQGKSSTIQALIMALGGKFKIPEKPVHADGEFGAVFIDLGDFSVELTIPKIESVKDREKIKLKVSDKEGKRISAPQQFLDQIFNGLSFDPGTFKTLTATERRSKLMGLVGLNFSDLEEKQKDLAQERTIVGRELKNQKAKIEGIEPEPELPPEEVSIADLSLRLEKAQDHNNQVFKTEATFKEYNKSISEAEKKIAELQKQIEEIRSNVAIWKLRSSEVERELSTSDIIDLDPIREQIRTAEDLNQKIRANRVFLMNRKKATELSRRYEILQIEIEKIDDKKRDSLNAAEWPIPGLGFDGDDITFDGIPFSQISESQQWQIATAIAFKLNPQGIVFMRQMGGLDKDSRDAIRARASDLGVQLFLEVVDDAEDVEILIEDGGVKEDRTQYEHVLELKEHGEL